jgi:hypothetical protein
MLLVSGLFLNIFEFVALLLLMLNECLALIELLRLSGSAKVSFELRLDALNSLKLFFGALLSFLAPLLFVCVWQFKTFPLNWVSFSTALFNFFK